jgi:hypothetical protein
MLGRPDTGGGRGAVALTCTPARGDLLATLTDSVDIDASVADTWQVLRDVSILPELSPSTTSLEADLALPAAQPGWIPTPLTRSSEAGVGSKR